MAHRDVTLKDIAQAVGKSTATVSKALRGHEDIAPETRETIQSIAQQMGYRPNIAAQRLKKRRTDSIGLILPVLSSRQADPFLTELLSGIADEVARYGFDLLVSTRGPGEQETIAYRRLVNDRRVDGLIIARPRRRDWRIRFLENRQFPFVAIGYFSNSAPSLPGIWVDTESGLRQAVAHLVEQDRTRIALLSPPEDLLFADAFSAAFHTIVKAYPVVTDIVTNSLGEMNQKEGYRMAHMLMASSSPPDALLACHDLVAMGAMAAVQDQGFEVGSDIAVVGFGDILLADHAQPPLTSLHQPTYSMGQQACRMLLSQIDGASPAPMVIEPWLVARQSSNLALWL